MVAVVAGVLGIVAGAWLSSLLSHRQWVRERRLTEYATFLTAFRTAMSAMVDTIGAWNAGQADRTVTPLLVEAVGARDEFYEAYNRVRLVATTATLVQAEALERLMWQLRHVPPIDKSQRATEWSEEDAEAFTQRVLEQTEAFVRSAAADALYIRWRIGR